jgi:hypothetical protein
MKAHNQVHPKENQNRNVRKIYHSNDKHPRLGGIGERNKHEPYAKRDCKRK